MAHEGMAVLTPVPDILEALGLVDWYKDTIDRTDILSRVQQQSKII